jgi:hypothetical protein
MNAHWVMGYGFADAQRESVRRTTTNTFGHQTGRCLAIQEQHLAAFAEIERARVLERAGKVGPRGWHHASAFRVAACVLVPVLVLAAWLIG